MILGTTPLDGQGKVPRMTVLAGVRGMGIDNNQVNFLSKKDYMIIVL